MDDYRSKRNREAILPFEPMKTGFHFGQGGGAHLLGLAKKSQRFKIGQPGSPLHKRPKRRVLWRSWVGARTG